MLVQSSLINYEARIEEEKINYLHAIFMDGEVPHMHQKETTPTCYKLSSTWGETALNAVTPFVIDSYNFKFTNILLYV